MENMEITSQAKGWISRKILVTFGVITVLVIIGVIAVPQLIGGEGPSDGLPKDEAIGSGKGHAHGEVIGGGSNSKYPVVTVQQPTVSDDSQLVIESAGQVLAAQHANIYPRREGIVQSLSVNLGDRVYKGQVVASLQPDKDQAELAAELAFKEKELDIEHQRQTIEEGTVTNVAQAAVTSAEKEREAQLKRVDAEIEAALIRKQQGIKSIENSAFDLLDTGAELLYKHIDTLSNLARDALGARRLEVFYGNQKVSEATEAQLLKLNRMLMGKEKMLDTKELITYLNDLSMNIRLLPSSANTNGTTFTTEQLDHLREKINEVTDEFYEKSQGFVGIDAELLVLKAEKEEVRASTQQRVIDLQSAQKGAGLGIQMIEAEIDRIKRQMGAARTVYAPFSGVITKRFVNIGDSVDLERPLYTIVDDKNSYVRFFVTEEDIVFIREGTEIEFAPTFAPSERYTAIISRIARSIDPETRSIQVEADIPSENQSDRIISQMTVRTYVPTAHEEDLIAIPDAALELSGRSDLIWIVNDAVEAEPRSVIVRYIHKGTAFIEEGLDGEEWIIIKSPVKLKEELEIDTTTAS